MSVVTTDRVELPGTVVVSSTKTDVSIVTSEPEVKSQISSILEPQGSGT